MLLQDSEWHAGMSLLTLAWGNKLRPEHVWAAAKECPAAVNETDACGATVLHVAAVYANLEAVEALLAAGADPNARTAAPTHIVYTYIEPGSAPLHFAVHHDIPHACLEHNPLSDVLSAKAGIVQALLAAGADAAAANSAGCTRRCIRWPVQFTGAAGTSGKSTSVHERSTHFRKLPAWCRRCWQPEQAWT